MSGAGGGAAEAYFDNAATSYPKPEQVLSEVARFMREVGGSAGRSGHSRAVETGRIVYAVRESLARLFNISEPLRLAFTRNATEALNIAISSFLKPGGHAVTTSIEHNSVMRPLSAAAVRGARYSIARCHPDGSLDPAALERELRPETSLVVVSHASNVTGTILPVADVAEVTRGRGIPLLVDVAQTAGRLEIDVEAQGIDLLAFTGHKELFGPQGTGGLYVREGMKVEPLTYGGTGSHSSSLEQPTEMPDALESGTLNAPGIAGLGAGVDYIRSLGMDTVMERERELLERLIEELMVIDGVRIHGPEGPGGRVGIIPMTFDAMSPADAAEALDSRGVCSRAGLHCSPMAHETIGTLETGALRVSLSCMNTADEVDYLLECLRDLTQQR